MKRLTPFGRHRSLRRMSGGLLRSVALFSVSSSSLLLTNKLLLAALPFPSLLSACQLAATAGWVVLLRGLQLIPPEPLVWSRVREYLVYVLFFTCAMFSNMKALSENNVETLIVVRSCCPLFVSLLEWCFTGRALPTSRSVALLCLLVMGAIGYAMSDPNFELKGLATYRWALVYYLAICFSDTCAHPNSQFPKLPNLDGTVSGKIYPNTSLAAR